MAISFAWKLFLFHRNRLFSPKNNFHVVIVGVLVNSPFGMRLWCKLSDIHIQDAFTCTIINQRRVQGKLHTKKARLSWQNYHSMIIWAEHRFFSKVMQAAFSVWYNLKPRLCTMKILRITSNGDFFCGSWLCGIISTRHCAQKEIILISFISVVHSCHLQVWFCSTIQTVSSFNAMVKSDLEWRQRNKRLQLQEDHVEKIKHVVNWMYICFITPCTVLIFDDNQMGFPKGELKERICLFDDNLQQQKRIRTCSKEEDKLCSQFFFFFKVNECSSHCITKPNPSAKCSHHQPRRFWPLFNQWCYMLQREKTK